ncbi:hypothetical protein ACQ86N_17300 [Puia sp. P3]|uniref:hypothetical protein n=1 Tax=Puia sp. P3 TaxID=3423952 RepID=UPI003D67B6BA
MKTLFSLLTLFAIVFAYILSANFYLDGQLFVAYLLVVSSISSMVFWIKTHDLLHVVPVRKA